VSVCRQSFDTSKRRWRESDARCGARAEHLVFAALFLRTSGSTCVARRQKPGFEASFLLVVARLRNGGVAGGPLPFSCTGQRAQGSRLAGMTEEFDVAQASSTRAAIDRR
jgi:hypothetical protein